MQFAPIAQFSCLRRLSVEDIVVSHCSADTGARLPWHAHEHACIVMLMEGSFVERFGHRTISCANPVALYKPAGERHANEYGRAGARFLIVEILPRRLDRLRLCGDVWDGIRAVQDARMVDLAASLHRELAHADAYSTMSIEGLVYEVCAGLGRGCSLDTDSVAPLWLRRVRDALDESFTQRHCICDLAEQARVHPDHLSRLFRRHFGVLIGTYIRNRRLDWAAKQLATTSASLADLAIRSGFADQSEFTRRFREYHGMTPGRYRESRQS
jgi:AraC family transcriptional regulator